jgi:hypothetical protein
VKDRWRRLVDQVATVSGVGRRGFFVPYAHAGELPAFGRLPPYEALALLFADRQHVFEDVLDAIEDLAHDLERIGDDHGPAARWRQTAFPRLDAAAAYTLLRNLEPAHVVEVGAGFSTHFLARAAADGNLDTVVSSIDPAPRVATEGSRARLLQMTVAQAGLAPFKVLQAADILSVDSSHVFMPGTDVDFLINRVLPALPAGVYVHFHDVFLPDDYPAAWAARGYNEQCAVAALLTGGGWRLVWSSRWVTTRMKHALKEHVVGRLFLADGAQETSLWLEKVQETVLSPEQA